MRRVGVEKSAAVGAEHLDCFLRGDRAHGQRLRGRLLQRCDFLVGVEVLDDALSGKYDGDDDRERQQHIQCDTGQIYPGVTNGVCRMAGKAANQGDDDGDAGGGREEVLHRERQHLRQITHRRFAGVALPVGVGDKTDGRVKG